MFTFIKRGWAQTNPWKWVALFIFEFVVVLLGVLVAQRLQEQFEVRREAERFAVTKEVLDEQALSAGTNLLIRGLQAQCIRDNLTKVRTVVRSNAPDDISDLTAHPPHPPVTLSVWSSEVARDARRFLDPDTVRHYDYLHTMAENVTESRHAEEEWWANVIMATDGARSLSERERSDVVLASYKLDHAFEGWDRAGASFASILIQLGMEPDFDRIERIHSGEGVCREEVSSMLGQWRDAIAEAKRRYEAEQTEQSGGEGSTD